jgi:hypothetical protein
VNLATFIESNIDALLHDWVAQAQRLGVAASLAQDVNFEDSARLLLEQIAQDMQHAQSDVQRDAKSFGQLPDMQRVLLRSHVRMPMSASPKDFRWMTLSPSFVHCGRAWLGTGWTCHPKTPLRGSTNWCVLTNP